jgi:hypothetical protein
MPQVAPSKTDAERLLLVSPELAEVLTAVIFRVRAGSAALPLVPAYDVFGQTRRLPMPFLFQRPQRPVVRNVRDETGCSWREDGLADRGAFLERPVCRCGLGQREDGADDRLEFTVGGQGERLVA